MNKIILFLLFVSTTSLGQAIRKYSNEFMSIGVDARSFGMASAMAGHTNDVNAGYWHPAGLINIEDSEAALMHASYFANIAQYDYLAYAKNIDNESAWGVSMMRFGVAQSRAAPGCIAATAPAGCSSAEQPWPPWRIGDPTETIDRPPRPGTPSPH